MLRKALRPILLVGVTALAAALASTCGPPAPRMGEGNRYVVITSDDAGLCPAVNAATIDAIERGLVSSVSMMTCCPGFDAFAEYAAAHRQGDYGIHLTLTSELPDFRWGPVLGGKRVPSLVREDGTFWRTVDEVARHVRVEEVERELRAQIQRAIDRGIELTHLDHHMFALFARPELFELYVRLAIDFDLPIRIRREPPPDVVARGLEMVRTYRRQLERIGRHGFPVFDFIDDENYNIAPSEKRNYYIRMMRSLRPGVSEIVMHCAYDWHQAMRAPAAERREVDTRVFMSPDMEAEIGRLGVHVLSWKAFRRMAARSPVVPTRERQRADRARSARRPTRR